MRTQASATFIFISDETEPGGDISTQLLRLTDSDSILIKEVKDSTREHIFDITGDAVDASGYVKLPVSSTMAGSDLRDGKELGVALIFGGGNGGPAAVVQAGSILHFGGDLGSGGDYYAAHGTHLSPSQSSLGEASQIPAPFAGKIQAASWHKNDTGDATLKVWKNGAAVETWSASGSSGSNSFDGAETFVAGDLFAIEYDSDDAPGKGLVELYIVPT